MNTLRSVLGRAALFAVALLALFSFTLAFADAGRPAAEAAQGGLNDWIPVIAAALGLVGFAIKHYTPATGFWHTSLGNIAITGISGAVGAAADLFAHATYVPSKHTLVMALITGISGALGASKPTGTSAAALLPFLLAGFLVPGCATLTPAQRAQGAAYAACMDGKGVSAATSVGQEAWTDLNTGADSATILTQLEELAGRAGIDAVACAIDVWLHPAAPAMLNPSGVAAAKEFLSKRASLERPRSLLVIGSVR